MAYFEQTTIEKVLASVDIVDYIGRDIDLKRAGVNYKGCCPIHKEETPSFIVSPNKNIYKCFGCGEGGNIIKYVMQTRNVTFTEAMELLCDEFHIEYSKKERTPEQLEAEHLRFRIIKANELAQKYFVENIKKNEPAKNYALSRWTQSTINEIGVGYAPPKGFLQYAKEQAGFDAEFLFQAGLAGKSDSGEYYDFFTGRITIPIRNRTGIVVGFTCRNISGKTERAKYLNTKDTPLFSKGEQLFGEFEGLASAKRNNRAFLVEGAPDAIKVKQCGYDNVFAPLGTALTKEQIEKIKSVTTHIVIIPDTDTAGIKALNKNALNLISQGFNVSYIKIEEGKDIDEAVKDRVEFEYLLETHVLDFFQSFTKEKISTANNKSEQADIIQQTCEHLIKMDERTRDMYVNEFAAILKPKKLWTDAIKDILNNRDLVAKTQKNKNEESLFRQYGFFIENNSYYGRGDNGSRQWSNFVMKPIAHIRSMINSKRLYELENDLGHKQAIELKQEYLVSIAKFRVAVESMGYYLWLAGEREMFSLKHYLYGTTITCEEITQLGWQKRNGFWAWGNGVFYRGEFHKVNEYGIVTIDKKHYYVPAFSRIYESDYQMFQFERRFVHVESNDISFRDYTDKMMQVCGDNAMVGICFLIASIFRDVIVSHVKNFPILNLFGPKGTGKSQLGHSLTSFFVIGNNPPNINNTTIPALSESVAQVSNSIVHIDEYKNNLELDRREFLKGLWDGAGRTRMNMDRDKKRETTAVDAAVVLSGQEMPTADIALFSRLIFLIFNKNTYTEVEEKLYKELKRIESRGLSHLTNQLLTYRDVFENRFSDILKATVKEYKQLLSGKGIEDRLFNNWITVVAAYKTIEKELAINIDNTKLKNFVVTGILNQQSKTQQNDELAGFWDTVENLHRQALVQPDANFIIKYMPRPIKLRGFANSVQLDSDKKYLLISFNLIAELYLRNAKITGSKLIPKDSLKYYLENSTEYIGIVDKVRFKQIDPRTKMPAIEISADQRTEYKYTVTTAMLFDYEKIAERYGISIDTVIEREFEDISTNDKTPVFTSENPVLF